MHDGRVQYSALSLVVWWLFNETSAIYVQVTDDQEKRLCLAPAHQLSKEGGFWSFFSQW